MHEDMDDERDDEPDEGGADDRRRRIAWAIAAVVFSVVAIVPAIVIQIAEPQEFRQGCWIHEPPDRLADCLPEISRP